MFIYMMVLNAVEAMVEMYKVRYEYVVVHVGFMTIWYACDVYAAERVAKLKMGKL